MAETTMPATEAIPAESSDSERNSYEFAFHILPTVAEEEVPGVFDGLKANITQAGGEIFSEEAPERIELAYDIVKQADGKNKRYGSAYFGWVRFTAEPDKIDALTDTIAADPSLLRYLLIKLTRVEEANPFRYHEHRKADKMVEVFDEEEGDVLSDPLAADESKTASTETSTETSTEASAETSAETPSKDSVEGSEDSVAGEDK